MKVARLDVLIRGVASAPLTFVWLLVLLVTTRIQRSAGRHGSRRIQHNHSTNLRRLGTEPSRVLATSLFWLDERKWWPYVPVFVGVVAPAERRLRWWRWLLVGASAHVIATYVGQSYLRLSIRNGKAPRRLVNARDVGVYPAALATPVPGGGCGRVGRQCGGQADIHRIGTLDGLRCWAGGHPADVRA
jgi:hypothetical protein